MSAALELPGQGHCIPAFPITSGRCDDNFTGAEQLTQSSRERPLFLQSNHQEAVLTSLLWKGSPARVSRFQAFRHSVFLSLAFVAVTGHAAAVHHRLRNPATAYAPAHSWSLFGEYSPSSSHIILGEAREREFITLGLAYTHNLLRTRHWDLNYLAEIRPLMAESDPVSTGYHIYINWPGQPVVDQTVHYVHEVPVLEKERSVNDTTFYIGGLPYILSLTTFYGRRWTYVGGMSPLGLKLNLLRHCRVQPTFQATGGFAASARDIPMFKTSAGNFTFSFGAGFEIFRRNGRSLRLQYRIQHFSNGYVGSSDPGIDSQMLYAGYSWNGKLLRLFHRH